MANLETPMSAGFFTYYMNVNIVVEKNCTRHNL